MATGKAKAAFVKAARRADALARAIDGTRDRAAATLARRLPVEARRDIQTEYNLPAARIRDGLTARRGAGFVELRASKRGIGLINFGGRWPGRKSAGAIARVFRNETAHSYAGTFIAKGRGGNLQIFERRGKGALPLRVFYAPSLAQMLRKLGRKERLALFARQFLVDENVRINRAGI